MRFTYTALNDEPRIFLSKMIQCNSLSKLVDENKELQITFDAQINLGYVKRLHQAMKLHKKTDSLTVKDALYIVLLQSIYSVDKNENVASKKKDIYISTGTVFNNYLVDKKDIKVENKVSLNSSIDKCFDFHDENLDKLLEKLGDADYIIDFLNENDIDDALMKITFQGSVEDFEKIQKEALLNLGMLLKTSAKELLKGHSNLQRNFIKISDVSANIRYRVEPDFFENDFNKKVLNKLMLSKYLGDEKGLEEVMSVIRFFQKESYGYFSANTDTLFYFLEDDLREQIYEKLLGNSSGEPLAEHYEVVELNKILKEESKTGSYGSSHWVWGYKEHSFFKDIKAQALEFELIKLYNKENLNVNNSVVFLSAIDEIKKIKESTIVNKFLEKFSWLSPVEDNRDLLDVKINESMLNIKLDKVKLIQKKIDPNHCKYILEKIMKGINSQENDFAVDDFIFLEKPNEIISYVSFDKNYESLIPEIKKEIGVDFAEKLYDTIKYIGNSYWSQNIYYEKPEMKEGLKTFFDFLKEQRLEVKMLNNTQNDKISLSRKKI